MACFVKEARQPARAHSYRRSPPARTSGLGKASPPEAEVHNGGMEELSTPVVCRSTKGSFKQESGWGSATVS